MDVGCGWCGVLGGLKQEAVIRGWTQLRGATFSRNPTRDQQGERNGVDVGCG